MTIKVNDSGTLKEPTQIFVKGDQGTLYGVNYVVANNNGTLGTVWNAVYATTRDTSTDFSTTTSYDTTTTYTTTFSTGASGVTSTSYTTSYNTSRATGTSRATTTSYTTTYGTSRGTSRSTTTSYTTSYTTSWTYTANRQPSSGSYYSLSPFWMWLTLDSNNYLTNIYWNGTTIYNNYPTGINVSSYTTGGWTYYRSTFEFNDGYGSDYYRIYRRQNISTSRTTSRPTSRSTTTSYTTSYNTSRGTSKSTTTSFNTTTTFGTSNTTSRDTNTSNLTNTSRSTSHATGTSRSTTTNRDTATVVYERLTATGNQTEVTSGSAHNGRYWDGSQWTED